MSWAWRRTDPPIGAPARTLVLFLAVVCLGGGARIADAALQAGDAAAPPSTVPRPRDDANSRTAHAELLAKARTGVIDVYFVGDSITRRWGALDYPALLENWTANFFGWNAANFGWGGDRTEHILWRLENGELDGVDPRVIVVQAGTNNLRVGADPDTQIASIAAGIEAIVQACRAKAPGAVIVLTGVFPRRDRGSFDAVIDGANEALAAFAGGAGVRFLDINEELSDDDGRLLDSMSDDGLHLSAAGYQVWADALRPVLTEILGPPAERDLAPPPTGNPAAR